MNTDEFMSMKDKSKSFIDAPEAFFGRTISCSFVLFPLD